MTAIDWSATPWPWSHIGPAWAAEVKEIVAGMTPMAPLVLPEPDWQATWKRSGMTGTAIAREAGLKYYHVWRFLTGMTDPHGHAGKYMAAKLRPVFRNHGLAGPAERM